MKIKKYIAPDMTTLINLVKSELGEDAAVISTSNLEDGNIELIAAADTPDVILEEDIRIPEDETYNDAPIRGRLIEHGVTTQAQTMILSEYRKLATDDDCDDIKKTLERTFDKLFAYDNFWNSKPVKIFVGPHGSGKTITLVKVALSAKMRGITTKIISTDNIRAGAIAEIKAFADILGSDFEFVGDEEKLPEKIMTAQSKNQMILIDTGGISPYLSEDISRLRRILKIIDCDKVLTMDAGYNADDAALIAGIFADAGTDWFFPTKMDITRKIGSLLSISAVCGMKLGYAGVGSKISGSLATVNSHALVRLLME